MTEGQTIKVPERGAIEISSAVWSDLSQCSLFWGLVNRGILSVEQLQAGRARLCGSCYVGRSRVSDKLIIELHEKVPGSLAALLRFASGTDFRVERTPGPNSELGPLIVLLVKEFVGVVQQYAAQGRKFQYIQQPMKGSLIGGRVDITGTIRLWARGLRHWAAFEKSVVSFDLSINSTVLAALREVERIGEIIPIPCEVIAQVRAMAMLFSDCRNAEVLFGNRANAAQLADELSSSTKDKVVADMLAMAAIVLSHESFESDYTHAKSAPRSWFLNLETLFERAVREVLKTAVGYEATVTSGRAAPVPIFPPDLGYYKAEPDLVLRRSDRSSICVGDVKYKEWSGKPSSGDIYQLLTHTAAYEAKNAFLVFPSDDYRSSVLGVAVTGANVKLFSLDVQKLNSQVSMMLIDLGFIHSSSSEQNPVLAS